MNLLEDYGAVNSFGILTGNEAIDFQISSQLGKKLTEIFQDVIDYRDNLDYTKIPDNASEQRKYRITAVYEYFVNNTVKKFQDIVFKETGLTVKKLYALGGMAYDASGYFACELTFGKPEAAFEVLGNMSGTNHWSGPEDAVNDMMTMADYFDPKTGKVSKRTWGKQKNLIGVRMFFDVNTAFCIHDFIPANTTPDFTAREIAAIMMHEIGHGISTIEHSGDIFATIASLDNYRKHLSKSNSPEELLSFLKGLDTKVFPYWNKKAKLWQLEENETSIAQKVLGFLSTSTSAMRKYAEEVYDQNSENFLITIGSFVCNIIAVWLSFLVAILTSLFVFLVIGLGSHAVQMIMYSSENSRGGKAGDVMTNARNLYVVERWADEYVVRHGFGADLATGLDKVLTIFRVQGMVGNVGSARLRHSSIFGFILKIHAWLYHRLNLINLLEPVIYESDYRRLMRIVQNTNAFFRDHPELPGQIRDQWLMNLEVAVQTAKDNKNFADTAFAKAMLNILRNFGSPVRWVQLLHNAGIARDMERLLDNLDDLKNNSLYSTSVKFASLADKF